MTGADRARHPDRAGDVVRSGVRVHWESYGAHGPALLFLPTWSVVDARCWKLQIADFARRHRVIVFDPRGNGRSDRPADPAAYREPEFAADALAVLDATETAAAVVVGLSLGAQRALLLAAKHGDRCDGLVLVGPALQLGVPRSPERGAAPGFATDTGVDEGWARYNAHSWRRDFAGFLEFFAEQVFPEPHSTRHVEQFVAWGLETDPETLITAEVPGLDEPATRALCARVHCPVLVVHGGRDRIVPPAVGAEAARLLRGRLATLAGAGHCPQLREPVAFDGLLREFLATLGR
jgi:pimeloyl-ACP methyl ester carboxylesterase